ncbi:hypothetical protein RvY_03473 [Ramazzottius varieornatus]|uniref:Uncharacterized protein n=1 Tax=Ramazzottius varieornatus TaxID=947166 RepID=A0A1D1UTX4_RAMVA|nr:hypothetical protein RvY_03473 [Ramazzottius varieornatus]
MALVDESLTVFRSPVADPTGRIYQIILADFPACYRCSRCCGPQNLKGSSRSAPAKGGGIWSTHAQEMLPPSRYQMFCDD